MYHNYFLQSKNATKEPLNSKETTIFNVLQRNAREAGRLPEISRKIETYISANQGLLSEVGSYKNPALLKII